VKLCDIFDDGAFTAADSSGFGTTRFVKWFAKKYGVGRSGHDRAKAHIMCGVGTDVVTAVEIHEPQHDRPALVADALAIARRRRLRRERSPRRRGALLGGGRRGRPRNGGRAAHRLQQQRDGRQRRAVGGGVPLLVARPRRLLETLPPAVERGIDLLDGEGEVLRPCAEQDRRGDEERGLVLTRLLIFHVTGFVTGLRCKAARRIERFTPYSDDPVTSKAGRDARRRSASRSPTRRHRRITAARLDGNAARCSSRSSGCDGVLPK
jgi:hypothetical protein